MSEDMNEDINEGMTEDMNKIVFNFRPKTDETFIAPNEMFNSFSQKFCNFGLKTNETQNTKPNEDKQSSDPSEGETTKRKSDLLIQTNDKFVDFIVKQYKSDGFVCTLDENERQIYYCYYCHQYVNDLDLIQKHIDTRQHLNSVLNGISLKRGLDKEFVIESVSEKPPKNLNKLIFKELSRFPLHLKHYYFRNGIRLMDVLPPNAYFCTFCKQSIPDLKQIDIHLLTETHKTSQQKPTLMQLIDKSDDLTLKIGLKFITEDKISDSYVVYECELCHCFDCNNEKMFSHLKSREHRINLLKKYNYETNDLTEENLEKVIKEMHEKYGSTAIKPNDCNKKPKISSELTPKSISSSNTPLVESLDSSPGGSPQLKPEEETNVNYFIREDTLLTDFECHKIIKTYESDGREIYYCCYCDQYFNTFASLERHVEESSHKKFQTNYKNCSKGLNYKLLMKRFSDPSVDTNEPLKIQALNEISNVMKHFYFKRGIKYTGADYYCRLCQKSISSFDEITEHFKCESHLKIEEKPTKFNDFLFQTTHPIIGLKYIKECFKEKSKKIVYECTLCEYSDDFCQMFFHLTCFTHQFKALRKISPNSHVFKKVKEKEVSLKSSELLKKEIFRIEQRIGSGFVTKIFDTTEEQQMSAKNNSKPSLLRSVQNKPQKTRKQSTERKSTEKQKSSEEPKPLEEEKPNCDDKECTQTQSTPLSEELLLSYLKTLFSVQLHDENEASILVSIVESLKDNLIKYYIPNQLQTTVEPNVTQSVDNYEICEMDEN